MFLVKKARVLLGTTVSVAVVYYDVKYAEYAVQRAFDEVKRIENLMNIYDEHSEVSKLNEQGFLRGASADLVHVIREAGKIWKLTDKVFDITILPLIEFLDKNFSVKNASFMKDLKNVLELVNYGKVKVYQNNIKFLKRGMKITLNGIAKGYAIDRAIEILIKHDIKHALINAGGDIRAIGGKTVKEPWRIAIRDPFNKQNYITVLKIWDAAVSTSGSYERRIAQGMVSHILKPRTNSFIENIVSATVISDKALKADAFATSLCAMEPSKGIKMVEELDGIEAMIVTKDGEIMKTEGFKSYEVD